jgi:hypothetical protein
MTEKHYVIVANMQRFRVWAHENITDEEWMMMGFKIVTATKEYHAVMALHHLRGATLTKETIHWTDGWFMGMTGRGADEMERYAAMCIAMGESK